MHFAVALSLGDHPIGVLFAGQVSDPSPEQRPREHIAGTIGPPFDGARQPDRPEPPAEQATFQVYAELLGPLGQRLLERHYNAFREWNALDEMTRLRDGAIAELAELRRTEESGNASSWCER